LQVLKFQGEALNLQVLQCCEAAEVLKLLCPVAVVVVKAVVAKVQVREVHQLGGKATREPRVGEVSKSRRGAAS
jgi:hypothetical protein